MNKYHIHIQGWAHSMTAYGMNPKDAVVRFKKQHGMTRMPRGYSIWSAT
jgi:hypothetical protein